MLKVIIFLLCGQFLFAESLTRQVLIVLSSENENMYKNMLYTIAFARNPENNVSYHIINVKNDDSYAHLKAKIQDIRPDFILTYKMIDEILPTINAIKDKKIRLLTFDESAHIPRSILRLKFGKSGNVYDLIKVLQNKDKYNFSFILPATKFGHEIASKAPLLKGQKTKVGIRDILFFSDEETLSLAMKKVEQNLFQHVRRDKDRNIIFQDHRMRQQERKDGKGKDFLASKAKKDETVFTFDSEKLDVLYVACDGAKSVEYMFRAIAKSEILSKNLDVIFDCEYADQYDIFDFRLTNMLFTGLNFEKIRKFNDKFFTLFNARPNSITYAIYDVISILDRLDQHSFDSDTSFVGISSQNIEYVVQKNQILKNNFGIYGYNVNDSSFYKK